jgi:hypothetical protein
MKINLNYNLVLPKDNKDIKPLSNQELTFEYITQAVMNVYDKGLEGSLRRIWGRIQRKFDTAIESKVETVELEQAEQDFIKKTFEKAKFNPLIARYVQILEDEIDSWKN